MKYVNTKPLCAWLQEKDTHIWDYVHMLVYIIIYIYVKVEIKIWLNFKFYQYKSKLGFLQGGCKTAISNGGVLSLADINHNLDFYQEKSQYRSSLK